MPVTKSPLRYPGGKTQLSGFLTNLIKINNMIDVTYCEPFSGGFGAGLELLFSNTVNSIIINDIDVGIYSIWYAILYDVDNFINLIRNTPITIEEWKYQKIIHEDLVHENKYSLELAFSTFFLNRTNRSGIISGGPIGGYEQKGKYKIDCRFNREALIKKIININDQKKNVELYNLEANSLIYNVLSKKDKRHLFIFFDPPYYQQGKNLYANFFNHKNHQELYEYIQMLDEYKWIVTYDHEKNIEDIYKNYPALEYKIQYSANKVRKEKEYLFHSPNTKVESFDKVIFQ
ncbi:DNA adenine methylase [Aerococcus urinae]|uniref:DNA adenine methylase n=1 Tax=Aerococcus urinae TaxID=1376 RepID=UPI00227D0766|nr:DNA adenine methylase [Aerococcus urinae]MCY3061016.1 DNA adenine methylase [Aerococcus urinae]